MRLIPGILFLILIKLAHSARSEEVILPLVEMRDLSLPEALTKLQDLIDRKSKTKITIKLIQNPDQFPKFKRQVLLKEEDGKRISLAFTNIPASEAIKLIAYSSGGSVVFDKEIAYVFPIKGTTDQLRRKKFRLPKIPDAKPGYRDYREELAKMGMTFYKGTSAQYDPSSGKLIVVNTDDEISILEQIGCIGPEK